MYERILIKKHKAILFVLSKNACTSLKAHLVKVIGMPIRQGYPKYVHNLQLYHYPFLTEKEVLKSYQSYFKFCFVRNPWSRLVSCYKNRILRTPTDKLNYKNGAFISLYECSPKFRGGMSFEAFIDVVCQIPDSKADRHFRSQLFELTDRKGDLLMNYIGNVENIEKDFEQITEHSGLPFSNFPLLNTTTKKKSYRAFYTPKLIEKVHQRFAADIGFFNYQFEKEAPTAPIGLVDEFVKKTYSASEYQVSILKEKINLPSEEKIKLQKLPLSFKIKDFFRQKMFLAP